LQDQAHTAESKAHNTRWITWLSEQVTALGLKVYPSVANFLLVEFPPTGKNTAAAADQFLMKKGVIVRAVTAYGLPNCLRISVGSEDGNRAAVAALKEFMS
jgi:histidinol-phosphate aminotransferase